MFTPPPFVHTAAPFANCICVCAQPHGGTTLFQLQGVAIHPGPLDDDWTPDAIREELEDWAESVNCEVSFEDLNDLDDDEDGEELGDDWDQDELEADFDKYAKVAEKKHLPKK